MAAYIAKSREGITKLRTLGLLSRYDVCGYPSIFNQETEPQGKSDFVYPAAGEGGRCVRLFKVLQTNICENNCFYCANRKDRNVSRIRFRPHELAQLFMVHYKRRLIDGLFLSSGIFKSPDYSQEQMLETLRLLRNRYRYQGYVHFKILPGANSNLIFEASRLADRLSINVEAPGPHYLLKLTSDKDFRDKLLAGLSRISQLHRSRPLASGFTTQLVVGPGGESDRDILQFAHHLYRDYKLWRVYYSGFAPLKDTPLEREPPCSPWRELRLYQADFLLRKYHFQPRELFYGGGENLPLHIDPKLAWAISHPEKFPLEVNKASFWELMRIPGIGRISAERIVSSRTISKIRDLKSLKKLGVAVKRACDFITLDGRCFSPRPPISQKKAEEQLFL